MSTAELCPVRTDARTDAIEPRPGLTLYALADDLAQLLAERAEMAEAKEDTAAVDVEIERYMEQLPVKVDAVAHVLRTLESQVLLAAEEIVRLSARRRKLASAHEQLKRYCCAVLEQQPKPKRGSRKLEGGTVTLALVGNGGLEPLDISDEGMIPNEYKRAVVTMGAVRYADIRDHLLDIGVEILKESFEPDNKAIRDALAQPCWACEGRGGECESCGGTGKSGVPGARLLERGAHLDIR